MAWSISVVNAGQLSCLCLLPASCGPSAFSLARHEKLKSAWLMQGKPHSATTKTSVCHYHYSHSKCKITSPYQLGRRKTLSYQRPEQSEGKIFCRGKWVSWESQTSWNIKKRMKFKAENMKSHTGMTKTRSPLWAIMCGQGAALLKELWRTSQSTTAAMKANTSAEVIIAQREVIIPKYSVLVCHAAFGVESSSGPCN